MKMKFPEKVKFLFQPRRFKVLQGGRGSAKSYSAVQALLLLGLQKKHRILCTREFQNSIADSVHKLLADINNKFNLGYEILQNSIRHPVTGTEILFYGLKSNITKIKSLEGITICYVEEAENISEFSWDTLIPTIRKDGSEIWVVFNPNSILDDTYKRFVTPYIKEIARNGFYSDQTIYVVRLNFDDNPWFPQTLRDEMERCKTKDYQKYLNIWLGEPVSDSEYALIKPIWFDSVIDAHIKLNFKPVGQRVSGFDVADEGDDNKALVRRHGVVVGEIDDWADGDMDTSTDKIYNNAINNHVSDIVYDCVGVGAGVKYLFKKLDPKEKITYTGFSGNATPRYPDDLYQDDVNNKDTFRNLRAQYYWYLRDRFIATHNAITKGDYIDPDLLISISSDCKYLDLLKYELTNIQRKRGSANSRILIESKQDMKSRGFKSPNIADALMYCFANPIVMNNSTPNINIHYESQW